MKNFILIIIILLFLSCNKNPTKEYTITYKIYYDANHIVTKTVTNNNSGFNGGFSWSSNFGSNTIYKLKPGGRLVLEETSAPIEIVSYTVKNIHNFNSK